MKFIKNYWKVITVCALIGVTIGIFIASLVKVSPAKAWWWDWPTPTPTVRPTATPTIKPTCTPTPTPTVAPTSTPDEFHYVCEKYACVKVDGDGQSECEVDSNCGQAPTPTPQPTVEPTPVDYTDHSVQLGGAPQLPSCESPIYAPTVTYLGQKGNTFSYTWTTVKDGLHTYWIEYGATKDNLPYATIVYDEDVDLTMYGQSTNWMRVAGYDSGCVGKFSEITN